MVSPVVLAALVRDTSWMKVKATDGSAARAAFENFIARMDKPFYMETI
jgi:hypothetical protein